jgi:thiamine biosynthesis lipoprotein
VTSSKVHTIVVMDTRVSIRVVGRDDPDAVDGAFEWFRRIEHACSRFEPESELRRLAARPNEPVAVSDILFETTRFALALAEETDGAFDPTVGQRLEQRGFDRSYRTGARVAPVAPVTPVAPTDDPPTYRDVHVDGHERTLTIGKPLLLDLGAVAKGFAIDMAARELRERRDLGNFAIDAGGDLYLAGHNEHGEPWRVGIRHPRDAGATIAELEASNAAVCTSGDYLRPDADGGHHLLDPHTGQSARDVISATVTAPLAMVADGLATAAFVLGPERGIALLERHGVDGLLISPTLEQFRTRGA